MIYGIFGECDASAKLVRAALNDQLDTWKNLDDGDDETFALVIGVRKPLAIYSTIGKWAEAAGVWVEVYSALPEDQIQEIFGAPGYDKYHHSTRFMLDVVDRCLETPDNSTIYALVGEEDPPTDVARALCRALDNGLEVRDLAEAGITYIRTADNPLPPTEEANVAAEEEEMTLDEVGALADEGNEDAIDALLEEAKRLDLDPDEYPTWAELAEAIGDADDGNDGDDDDEDEPASDDDDDDSDDAPRGGGYTEAEIEEMDLPDVRLLAKSLGVEDYAKARRATLVREILAAQEQGSADDDDDADEADDDQPAAKPSKAKGSKASSTGDVPDEVLAAASVVLAWIRSS